MAEASSFTLRLGPWLKNNLIWIIIFLLGWTSLIRWIAIRFFKLVITSYSPDFMNFFKLQVTMILYFCFLDELLTIFQIRIEFTVCVEGFRKTATISRNIFGYWYWLIKSLVWLRFCRDKVVAINIQQIFKLLFIISTIIFRR